MMMLTKIKKATKNKILVVSAALMLIGLAAYFMKSGKEEEGGVPDVVDFNFHVRPILSDRCFKCHGPDANKREADLRLDTEEGAFAALKDDPSRHVIVPSDPLQSELYLRVISKDTGIVMPPPSSNLSLTSTEIEIIKKWIAQGATYKKHWSFIPPQKTKIPSASKSGIKGRLLIWAEQGIGDEIFHAGLLPMLSSKDVSIVLSADKRLHPIYRRSFPNIELLDKNILIPVTKESGWIDIDLSNYNLVFSGDIALSLEWIKVVGIHQDRFIKMNDSKQASPNVLFKVKRKYLLRMYTKYKLRIDVDTTTILSLDVIITAKIK